MSYVAEYTDTFGGQANYCWCRRELLDLPDDATDRQIVRAGKAAVGLTGVRCRTYSHGDMWEIRPYGMCTVLFIMWEAGR